MASAVDFKDHFSKLASQYAAFRPQYPPGLFEYIAGLCPERKTVWDCACGSGQASVALAEHFERVVATDASARQIEAATLHARVIYRVAPAENSGLEPRSIDAVTVAQALHWFDLERFYNEVDRVLKDNGVLAAWGYGVLNVEGDEINEQALHLHHVTLGPYWPAERKIVESGYRTLPFPLREITPPAFELSVHWPLERLLGYFRSWSATGRYVAKNNADPVTPVGEALARLWGDPATPRKITWPLALRVSRKVAAGTAVAAEPALQ